MAELPSGTVTFLFTDVEASTRLWEEHPDAMRPALARHDQILRDAVAAHDGHVVKSTGDGIHSVFATAHDALDAAIAAQLALRAEPFVETGPLRVRMGIHTCEAEYRDGDYYGSEVNRASRLMSVANGEQIVVSLVTSALVRDGSVELVDLGEHRLRDLTNREQIFQVRGPGLAAEFPPLRSLDARPGNLPRQVTRFVGREAEIASVAELVRDASVVTLTGVGGVGKTRLALQVAAEVVPHFRDGAWFAELAGVRDPEAVPDALVATFGLQLRDGLSATDTLVEFLAAKELLLVVDNCEHLIRAVAALVDVVVRGSLGVRILATSREGLNVAGERMLGVASLELPDDAAALGAIGQCDAVRLFVERAQAVKANFVLDTTNADAVVSVCRRLDGIALAIELAAARIAMLTPAEVARRLDSRFRLLASGQHSTVERHQTLRAAIDWSYDLLGETERLLLTRLSIFAGGFSLEAAEGVGAGGPIDADDVFELLSTLVARSLVGADTEGVETRYRLLETIRQYAQELLDASGDGDRLRADHATYYVTFSETAVAGIPGPDGIAWEHRFAREDDNVRAALTWGTDTGDVDTALRLLAVWDAPVVLPGGTLLSTARWTCETALDAPGASDHPRYPAALGVAAQLAWGHGDHDVAQQRCAEALAAEQRLGSEPSSAARSAQVAVALAQGHVEEAVLYARDSVASIRARGEPARLAYTLGMSVMARTLSGDSVAALPDAEEIADLVRRAPNPRAVGNALGVAAWALGDSQPERALALALEAIALVDPEAYNNTWAIAGDLADRLGERRDALGYFGKAIDGLHWIGNRPMLGSVLDRVAILVADRDPETAAVLQGANDALAPGYVHHPHTIEAHERAAAVVQAALSAERCDALRTQGMAMSDADAVDVARAAIARALADDETAEEVAGARSSA